MASLVMSKVIAPIQIVMETLAVGLVLATMIIIVKVQKRPLAAQMIVKIVEVHAYSASNVMMLIIVYITSAGITILIVGTLSAIQGRHVPHVLETAVSVQAQKLGLTQLL